MLYHYSIIGTVKATNLCKIIEKCSKSAKKMKKCAKRKKPPLSKGDFSVSKNLPLRDRLPRYGGGGACARGGAVPRRGGGREPCHSPKYFGQPYSSLPHRLRAEPPRRGGQGVSTPFSTVCHPSLRCSDSGWFVESGLDRSMPAGGTGKHPGEG